jgi:hypothetical protein
MLLTVRLASTRTESVGIMLLLLLLLLLLLYDVHLSWVYTLVR